MRHARRQGMVLLLVLVVLAYVALVGYSFESVMQTEYRASMVQGDRLQALQLAKSGIDRALALLTDEDTTAEALWSNPEQLRAVQVTGLTSLGESAPAGPIGRFSVVADDPEHDDKPRYGVTSEAAKLNIQTATREMLLELPGMTDEMADSLIDWRDSDETTSPSGAETPYYQSTEVPYGAKNASFESLEELLLVRGWTPRGLLGEDANRNGVLDPNENDSDASAPDDNGDGRLDIGLAPLLTVWSSEKNVNEEGEQRIYLNDSDLDDLHAKVRQAFSAEHADFVRAYREGKAKSDNETSDNDEDTTTQGDGTFDSVADLLEAVVEQEDDNGNKTEVKSPFTEADLDKMLDRLTTHKDKVIKGRVDVLRAPVAVLKALPGLSDSDASAIVGARANVNPRAQSGRTTAWLLRQDVISLAKFRQVEPWITTQSSQWSIEAVGYFDGGGPSRRVRAVVDVSGSRPATLYWRELTELGTAYDFSDTHAAFAR